MLVIPAKLLGRSITGEVSVNLNVSTPLSGEFIQFDDSIVASMRGSVVVELQKLDIFADINAFKFARDFAKELGYRICIDGLTRDTIPLINWERLGSDLVKILCPPDLPSVLGKKKARDIVFSHFRVMMWE